MVGNKLSSNSVLDLCQRSFSAALSSFVSSLKAPQKPRWLIAHSGGVDSQLLLFLAAKELPESAILVVHVNHHLQVEADSWAEFSRRQAERYGLKHCVVDVWPKDQSENAARNERYQAFEELMEEGDVLLLGHHADDQAETLLYRMLRGSGLAGMGGIPESRALGKGYILRPLLECSREQLESAVSELALDYVSDPSNDKDSYDRNYLRNQVLPVLKKRWPKLVQRWSENAALFQESNDLLEQYLAADLKLCTSKPDQFELNVWSEMDALKQSALLRHWFYSVIDLRVNSQTLNKIISEVIQARPDADPQLNLGAVALRRYRNSLYLVPDMSERVESIRVVSDGDFDLGDGCLQVRGLPPTMKLTISRRQGGESCTPIGKKHRAVKKILHEAKITPWHREQWPLAYCDDKLIAVPGVCLCQGFLIEENHEFCVLWRPFSLSDYS